MEKIKDKSYQNSNFDKYDAGIMRDIALKVVDKEELGVNDAIQLLSLALKANPNARFVRKKLKLLNKK